MSTLINPHSFDEIFTSSDTLHFTDDFVSEFNSNGAVLLRGFACNLDTQMTIANSFKNTYLDFFSSTHAPTFRSSLSSLFGFSIKRILFT
ncbi:hypothetical protein EBU71_06670 [bacterium]|nr:hypothetical protein [Candidatus Elulimicrobium humile]